MAATGKKKKLPPIDPEFINKMETSLLALKAEIVEKLNAHSEDFKSIMEGMEAKDVADMASDDMDRRMIEAIGAQELKRLKSIDAALMRIKAGKYGHCVKCSHRIPQERLIALPFAVMCIDCKNEEERKNR